MFEIPEVSITGPTWHLHGTAEIVTKSADVFAADQSQWHTVVKVTPIRLHILPDGGMANYVETIDFDPE